MFGLFRALGSLFVRRGAQTAVSGADDILRATAGATGRTTAREGAEAAAGGVDDIIAMQSRRIRSLEGSRWVERGLTALPFAGAAGIYGFTQLDRATGGEQSKAAVDALVSGGSAFYHGLTDTLSDEEKRRALTEWLHNAGGAYETVFADPTYLPGLTAVVRGAEDNAEARKRAAIVYYVGTRADIVAATTGARAAIYNEIYPDMSPQERSRLLAEGLIEDIIARTRCAELEGQEITREDIASAFREHPSLMQGADLLGLEDGLIQVLPGLQRQTLSTDRRRDSTSPTTEAFGGAAEINELLANRSVQNSSHVRETFNRINELDGASHLNWWQQIVWMLASIPIIGAWFDDMALDMLDSRLRERLQDFSRDAADGQLVGMSTLQRTPFHDRNRVARFEPADHGPAPELVGT